MQGRESIWRHGGERRRRHDSNCERCRYLDQQNGGTPGDLNHVPSCVPVLDRADKNSSARPTPLPLRGRLGKTEGDVALHNVSGKGKTEGDVALHNVSGKAEGDVALHNVSSLRFAFWRRQENALRLVSILTSTSAPATAGTDRVRDRPCRRKVASRPGSRAVRPCQASRPYGRPRFTLTRTASSPSAVSGVLTRSSQSAGRGGGHWLGKPRFFGWPRSNTHRLDPRQSCARRTSFVRRALRST